MQHPDFWDFALEGGWDLLFPDDEERSYICLYCKKIIKGKEKVEWVEKNKIFKCPECDKSLEIKLN
jgi:DNA-directed RNA polymerase subunit RPC12/RpoP